VALNTITLTLNIQIVISQEEKKTTRLKHLDEAGYNLGLILNFQPKKSF
jgi:predicted amino acid-binding ACT domain protein